MHCAQRSVREKLIHFARNKLENKWEGLIGQFLKFCVCSLNAIYRITIIRAPKFEMAVGWLQYIWNQDVYGTAPLFNTSARVPLVLSAVSNGALTIAGTRARYLWAWAPGGSLCPCWRGPGAALSQAGWGRRRSLPPDTRPRACYSPPTRTAASATAHRLYHLGKRWRDHRCEVSKVPPVDCLPMVASMMAS